MNLQPVFGNRTIQVIAILFTLFITVPLLELFLLLWLSHVTSIWVTFGTVLFTGILGTLLARSQGFSTWQKIRGQMGSGQMPGSALADAAMIFMAGALLMTPGLLTDAVGFLLLIPPCRAWMKARVLDWAKKNVQFTTTTTVNGETRTYTNNPSEVVDSYVVPQREEPKSLEN
ncbi:FxsA family protein [Blastopirellula marina]|uniref:FxsA family protein n=1 Tax=Blastopirellula marina TaxID=124 RepID=UPI001304CA17|nr:FxsA family protein [Blastopirellula marina]